MHTTNKGKGKGKTVQPVPPTSGISRTPKPSIAAVVETVPTTSEIPMEGIQQSSSSSDTDLRLFKLWCIIKGDSTPFKVKITGGEDIDELKKLVREEGKNGLLNGIDAKDLALWKVCHL